MAVLTSGAETSFDCIDLAALAARLFPDRPQERHGDGLRIGRRGSLVLDLKRRVWFDHEAGRGGGVLDLVEHARGGSREDALRWLREERFLPEATASRPRRAASRPAGTFGAARLHPLPAAPVPGPGAPPPSGPGSGGADDGARIAEALRIWEEAEPVASGTLAWRYLEGRGLRLPDGAADWVRFHPTCPGPGGPRPALVVLARDNGTGEPVGIQRTFLGPDGRRLERMSLGRTAGAHVEIVGAWLVSLEGEVAVAEGVEDALAVVAAGGPACWATLGCAGLRAFRPPQGVGRVLIFADRDRPGLEAARDLALALRDEAEASVILFEAKDPCAALAGGGGADERAGLPENEVRALLPGWSTGPQRVGSHAALALVPPPAAAEDALACGTVEAGRGAPDDTPPEVAAEVARLASLGPVAYDLERAAVAKRLGVRKSTIDEAVARHRSQAGSEEEGAALFDPVEPWPAPVGAAELLDRLVAALGRHLVMGESDRVAVALWVAHTFVFETFDHSPRLLITSPVKRCGKSTLLEILRLTCHRPIKADNISPSGVFRLVHDHSPMTLLLDEADTFLRENEELRGVLNSGFERSGRVVRTVEIAGRHVSRAFRTFAPLALAGIGEVPDTIADRSVRICLERKPADAAVCKLRDPGARAALHDLARQCVTWAEARSAALAAANPAIPEAWGDREGDISVPLLAVADDAGGAWPERARAALSELFRRSRVDEAAADSGTTLLADIRAVFDALGADRVRSVELVERLVAMEHRPWAEWSRGRPLTAPGLARLLKRFRISPKVFRAGPGDCPRGYERAAFKAAWARYLAAEKSVSAPPGG